MPDIRYRLILTGKVKPGFEFESVVDRLAALLKIPSSRSRQMLSDRPTVVRKGLDRETAERFCKVLEGGGIQARWEDEPETDGPAAPAQPPAAPGAGTPPPVPPPASEPAFDPCPKCGNVPLDPNDPARRRGECPFCGIIIGKYLAASRGAAGTRPLLVERMRHHPTEGPEEEKSYALTKVGVPLIVFALLAFVSSCGFNFTREVQALKRLPAEGGLIGPLQITSDRTVIDIQVFHDVGGNGLWNTVSGDVLDANKRHLFSFGKELWRESGYDSEGRWSENQNKFDMKVTLQKGIYYLRLSSDRDPRVKNPITVQVRRKAGSGLPFMIAGILTLVLGVVLVTIDNRGLAG